MFDLIDLAKAEILCGILSVYVLLLKKNALRTYSDYLLSGFILGQSWINVLYVLLFTGSITAVPFLFKTAAPITFLIPPLGYLYVRSILKNERKLSLGDLLHGLPFLFFLFNYLPFFLSDTSYKQEVLAATILDKNAVITTQVGLFSESVFHFARLIQSCIYLGFQWVLLVQFKINYSVTEVANQGKLVLRWLYLFSGAITLSLFSLIAVIGLYFVQQNIFDENFLSILPAVIFGASFFLICAYLLIYPQTRVGIPFDHADPKASLDVADTDKELRVFDYQNYRQEIDVLESYFSVSKAFLQPNLTISEVAVATGIPARELSYLINTYFKKRFSDYLNEMRVNYFLEQVDRSSMDSLTIEAIALQAGFSSKSSFYRAFKRFYGCTPSEYLQPSSYT